MSEKIHLHLLLLCGILCHGILAKLSDNDTKVSSDFLIRKRRVINNMPGGDRITRIEEANYIVKIREGPTSKCAGAILSHYTVITAALCVSRSTLFYKILSGATYDQRSTSHNVTSIVSYFGRLPHQPIDGIALVTVDPPFEHSRKTGNIELYGGPLPAGTLVTVSGWGCLYPIQPGRHSRPRLYSITLPIMNHAMCANITRTNNNHINIPNSFISEKHICTYHEEQYCARSDEGAPLVVHNMLAGIHVWKGEHISRMNPDIFINLQTAEYRNWINENTLLM